MRTDSQLLRPLPLANTLAFTPRGLRPGPHAQDWKQALAQAQPWRHEPQPQPGMWGADGQGAPRLAITITAPAALGMPASPTDSALQAPTTVVRGLAPGPTSPAAAVAEFATPASMLAPEIAGPAAPSALREARPAAQETACLPPLRRNAPAVAPDRPHVHVEQHAEGLAVWIGMAGGPEAIAGQVAALLGELRRNLHGPDRLAQVVCNGIPIYPAPRAHKETP
jgi:hypothetical protein